MSIATHKGGGSAAARRALESTYEDVCTVYSYERVKKNGVTVEEKRLRHEDIKCALSQKSSKPTHQTDTTNNISYDAKLFIAPELEIAAGSRIEVLRFGHVYRFISSGEPFLYETHQEIMLQRTGKA